MIIESDYDGLAEDYAALEAEHESLRAEHAELKEKHEKLRTQAQEFYDSSVAGWKAVSRYHDAIDELYAIRKS